MKLPNVIQYLVREYMEEFEIAILDEYKVRNGHITKAAEIGWYDGVLYFSHSSIYESTAINAFCAAAKNGHINIIDLLKEFAGNPPWQGMCEAAAGNDNFDMLLWLIEHSDIVINLDDILGAAVENNNDAMFRYCRDRNALFGSEREDAIPALVARNDVKMLAELPETFDAVILEAIKVGNTTMVNQVIGHLPYSHEYIDHAIETGQNGMLQLLHDYYDMGCIAKIDNAVKYSNEGAIRLMHVWGARNYQAAFEYACISNISDLIHVLYELGRKWIDIARVRDPIPPDIMAIWLQSSKIG